MTGDRVLVTEFRVSFFLRYEGNSVQAVEW